jgi:hypothetical protein
VYSHTQGMIRGVCSENAISITTDLSLWRSRYRVSLIKMRISYLKVRGSIPLGGNFCKWNCLPPPSWFLVLTTFGTIICAQLVMVVDNIAKKRINFDPGQA